MPGIREEIIVFFIAVIAGCVIRLCYEGISCLRNIFRHKLYLIEIEDIIYWIGTAIYLFVQIYYTSDGRIRWFFVLGVVLGVIVSTFFIQKMKKVLKKICDFYEGKNIAKNREKRYHYK